MFSNDFWEWPVGCFKNPHLENLSGQSWFLELKCPKWYWNEKNLWLIVVDSLRTEALQNKCIFYGAARINFELKKKKNKLFPLESRPVLLARNYSCGIVCACCHFNKGKVELHDLLKSYNEQLPVLFFSALLVVGSCFLLELEFSLKKKKKNPSWRRSRDVWGELLAFYSWTLRLELCPGHFLWYEHLCHYLLTSGAGTDLGNKYDDAHDVSSPTFSLITFWSIKHLEDVALIGTEPASECSPSLPFLGRPGLPPCWASALASGQGKQWPHGPPTPLHPCALRFCGPGAVLPVGLCFTWFLPFFLNILSVRLYPNFLLRRTPVVGLGPSDSNTHAR